MMVTGLTTKHTDLEVILILMEPNIKVIGKMINNTEKAKNNGLMALSTQVATNMVKKTVLENSSGLTSLPMTESLLIIIFMVKECIAGPMAENTKVTGSITKCTAEESLPGLTKGNMRESTMTIKNKDTVYSPGQMEDNMMASG